MIICNYFLNVLTGKANSKLIYDGGELSLVYENGSLCEGKGKTIITFVCDHSQSERGVVGPDVIPDGQVNCAFLDCLNISGTAVFYHFWSRAMHPLTCSHTF